MTFSEGNHRYTVQDGDNEPFCPVSVTTVCGAVLDKSGPLMGWAVKCALDVIGGAWQPNVAHDELFIEQVIATAKRAHRERKQEAANLGTQVHRALEAHFRGEYIGDLSEEVLVRANRGLTWLAEHEVEVVSVERRVYSRRHRVVGTLDKLAWVDGKLSILDWKTGGLHPEHQLQTACYQGCLLEEEPDLNVERRYLVRLSKDEGEFEVHEFGKTAFREDWRAFKAMLKGYRWLKGIN